MEGKGAKNRKTRRPSQRKHRLTNQNDVVQAIEKGNVKVRRPPRRVWQGQSRTTPPEQKPLQELYGGRKYSFAIGGTGELAKRGRAAKFRGGVVGGRLAENLARAEGRNAAYRGEKEAASEKYSSRTASPWRNKKEFQ